MMNFLKNRKYPSKVGICLRCGMYCNIRDGTNNTLVGKLSGNLDLSLDVDCGYKMHNEQVV